MLEGLLDRRVVRFQESVRDLPQGFQFRILDIFTLVLGESEEEDRTVGAKTSEQAKASSLALPGQRHTLLDDTTTQAASIRPRIARSTAANQAGIRNAVLTGEPRERRGLENTNLRAPIDL
jgi:hypothetical protein